MESPISMSLLLGNDERMDDGGWWTVCLVASSEELNRTERKT